MSSIFIFSEFKSGVFVCVYLAVFGLDAFKSELRPHGLIQLLSEGSGPFGCLVSFLCWDSMLSHIDDIDDVFHLQLDDLLISMDRPICTVQGAVLPDIGHFLIEDAEIPLLMILTEDHIDPMSLADEIQIPGIRAFLFVDDGKQHSRYLIDILGHFFSRNHFLEEVRVKCRIMLFLLKYLLPFLYLFPDSRISGSVIFHAGILK